MLIGILTISLSLAAGSPDASAAAPAQAADTACVIMDPSGSPAERRSPLDSVTVRVGGGALKVCYGRPSARGRTMIGGDAVPFGTLWRTGANEPTMLHATVPMTIAGVAIEPGTYALYTVPGQSSWEIVVNRSTSQWGDESSYTDEVRREEVGRGSVPVARTDAHVETFTIRAAPDGIALVWEATRVTVPVEAR